MFAPSPNQKNSAVNLTISESTETLTNDRTAVKSVSIVLACMMAHIVNSSNTSAVSVSLPTIGKELDIPEERLHWIVASGPLTTTMQSCFLMMFGRICDLYGRKKPFLLGSLWMAVFTLSLSFAKNDITFDILRGLQGIGRAAMMPAAVGILSDAFPSSQARRKAFAAFTAGQPLGDALGTVVGGVLTQLTASSWRSPLYLITALSVVTFVLGLYAIDSDRPSTTTDQRIDWVGAVLVSAGILLVVFVLSQGEMAPHQWRTSYIIALLLLGVTLIVTFVIWQRYLEQKYDTKLFKTLSAAVDAFIIVDAGEWACCGGVHHRVPNVLYYQNYMGLAPLATVTRLLPAYFTGVFLLFALINPASAYFAFGFPAAALAPAGAGFVYACTMIYVTKVVRPHEQGVVGAVVQTMTQLGSSLGVTLSTVISDQVSGGQAHSQRSPSHLDSYKAAEWTNFAFAALAALLALIVFRGVGVIEKRHSGCDKEESEPASDHPDIPSDVIA
ncbi:putative efflux transporter [Armillaria borealis]|uniref:Efflux transporter n=1 Tax=Armillaria borealis TaxID=47425 RepID=A0AA39JH88_9AGAR|nr:putative efflux transporter [Armillaria borealis]